MLRRSVVFCLARSARAPLVLPPGGRPALRRCLSASVGRTCAVPSDRSSSGAGSSSGADATEHGHGAADEDRPETETELRGRILEASLSLVGEHGWSTETLTAGAESLGLPGVAHGLFPRGGVQLVDYFYTSCNARLAAEMAERRAAEHESDNRPGARLGSQAFIRWAVEQRLRMLTPYLEQWPEALALLALPANLPTSLANFGALLDDVWYHAGDRSSDFNWYTKRGILAAVYKSTELRLLTDQSEDLADTWRFLDARLAEAVTAGRCVGQLGEVAPATARAAGVIFSTAANMVGLNSRR